MHDKLFFGGGAALRAVDVVGILFDLLHAFFSRLKILVC